MLIALLSLAVAQVSPAPLAIRYAIVVGSDVGTDPKSGKLPALLHAEEEAARLHRKLSSCCNFGSEEGRMVLLLRPTRADLETASKAIRAKMEEDARAFGAFRSMFAFFFTGHGLDGRILLSDGPASQAELRSLFGTIHADLTIGVFDACFSGSLTEDVLSEKGLRPTPGFNPLQELPGEMLTAEGNIWLVSSGPNESSYEDQALGGVFTHYLIEALDLPTGGGPGLSLDRIWSHAQRQTSQFASSKSRSQHPERIVSKMREQSVLYFSFPEERTSSLSFGPGVEGTFLLHYEDSLYTEAILKKRGQPKRVMLYPGRAVLSEVSQGAVIASRALVLLEDTEVALADADASQLNPLLSSRVEQLWPKGFGTQELRAVRVDGRWKLDVGASFALALVPEGRLAATQSVTLDIGLRRWSWVLEAGLGYGFRHEKFSSWGYRLDELGLFARGGLAVGLTDWLELCGLLGLRVAPGWQRYEDGAARSFVLVAPDGALGLSFRVTPWLALRAEVVGELLGGPAAGLEAGTAWSIGLAARTSARMGIW